MTVPMSPELKSAAGKLDNDVDDLTDAVEIINNASAAMGTITEVIKLTA